MKKVFSLLLAIILPSIAFAQSEGGQVRIYDAMPQTENAPRLAVWIGSNKIVADITPGEMTFPGNFPGEGSSIVVKDGAGATIGELSPAPKKTGRLLTAILTADGDKARIIPASVDIAAVKSALHTPGQTVFIPANLSSNVEYTFDLQTHDTPPKLSSITIKPYETAQFLINFEKMDWKLTAKTEGKSTVISVNKFPPLNLLKNRAAILMLPRQENESSEIVALDALGEGFIIQER
jgi:hypothetical protein